MQLRSLLVASISVLLLAILAITIIVLPAEVMFYLKAGKWYRAESIDKTAGDANDFKLYRKPFTIKKKPGRVRILTVGGSTTYGFGVKSEDTWPGRLEQKLNERYPGKFEVVNVAYLGGHLEGFISDFQKASRTYITREKWLEGARPGPESKAKWGWSDLDPDIVIVVPIVNDTAPDFTYMRSHGQTGGWRSRLESHLTAPPLKNLAISYYLKRVIMKAPHPTDGFRPEAAYSRIRESYKENLKQFISLWGTERRIYLLGLPWLFSKDDSSESIDLAMQVWGVTDQKELMDELGYFPSLEKIEIEQRTVAKKELTGYTLASNEIGKSLKARPYRERLRFYLDPVHVTAEGNELFAREIYDLVIGDNTAVKNSNTRE